MAYGKDRTNLLTSHAGDVTDLTDRNRIVRRNESSRLWAHGHTGTALDASIPANVKHYRRVCLRALSHQIFLYSEVGEK